MEKIELNSHSLDIVLVSKKLESSIVRGLTEDEAKIHLEKYGTNELIQYKRVSALQIFANQFKDFLVYLLIFAIALKPKLIN